MKQKNLILMVVAVGCGLAAALLTSTMSAKSAPETVSVMVAVRDLPVGTMLTADEIPKLLKVKKLTKDALPPTGCILEGPEGIKEMTDKRLSRALRADEPVNPKDLNTGGVVTLPPGMDMVSVPFSLTDAVAGFVTPGSRVDVLATAKCVKDKDRYVAFPLLVDMLILAVDNNIQLPKENGTFATVNSVSFAVDRDQALLFKLAKSRGVDLSMVLRNTDKAKIEEKWKPEDVLKFLVDGIEPGRPVETPKTPIDPLALKPVDVVAKVETVKLQVATADIPKGTEITEELIKSSFAPKDVPAPAPENAIVDLTEYVGKHLVDGVAANQWVAKKAVGYTPKDAPKAEAEVVKPGPQDLPPPAPAKRTHDFVVQTGAGHKTFRYEEQASGKWVMIGEVKNGSLDNSETPAPAPDKAPAKPIGGDRVD